MGSCHGANNSSNKTLIQDENLEMFTIIWLDDSKTKSQKTISIQQQLRTIVNYLKTFENEDDCEKYIQKMSKDEYIILIVNDQIGQKILPNIHHLQQLFSIYIYSPNKNIDQQWINQFNKVKSISIDYDELITQIKVDHMKCKYIKDEILFDIFRIDQSTDLNNKFLYSQILIDVLLQMDSVSNDITDLMSLCRNQYKGNKTELNILREFQQNYSTHNAVWWLTKDIFISQILNKALKIENIDMIFLFRFFLRDIEQQLIENQCLLPIKVYRYQLMSVNKLEILKNSIGQFLSINNFLLTNINRNATLPSSKVSLSNNNYQPILFEITADPNLNKIKAFADISSHSYFNHDEGEILFMLGSIFQLNNIYLNDNNIWIIEMTLSSKTNQYLKSIFDNFQNDDDEINLLAFGYILQKLNKSNDTEKYYYRLFNELSEDDERINYCCLNLGNIAFIKKDYDASLEWLLKSLDISLRTLQSNDMFLALIYNSMGHVYSAKHMLKSAVESYYSAISIWKQSTDENYLKIAECMNNIGIIYKQEKHYPLALDCFKETLNILEKYLSHNHFDLSKSHCNIANTYRQLGRYELALEHYYLSFKILEKYYSPVHPNLAKVLGNIGIVYALKGESEKALFYYEKALEIYRQTLPLTHINNLKIEQLIRNVQSPHRKIPFGTIESK
ncbi:unnamed protein product [Adineta steineri]|uniref:Uncharacterized protein n=1 Tax=Adineta steineri TaxID=433720 RepID=A0A814N3K1_9BILA|nr:unnamed protein product [Adineta steineri]CAF1085044.1 unnamed protein product [Adineta steineri]